MTDKLIDLLYENNVRCDVGVERLAEDIRETCKPKWISIKDRLPQTDGFYFTYYFGLRHFSQYFTSGNWYNTAGGSITDKVEYWMPLPEPPKENAND